MKQFFDIQGKEHTPSSDEPISWRISSYVIVFHPSADTKILMVKPKWHNQWEFAGGRVELGESFVDAAIRECKEESGYSISVHSPIPYYVGEAGFYQTSSEKFFHAIHIFLNGQTQNLQQDKDAVDTDGETEEVAWIELADLTEENTFRIVWPVVQLLQRQNLDLFF